ncbi:MAG: hypothetical protein A4E61_00029 [Syntrophorhabdus sp. PtaB.Bin184]|jgi:hypothetical protein|nr:MAG: hypothetical protein A4E61_00029 [Syntrophorhabdus sp. PtaB.Bin184]
MSPQVEAWKIRITEEPDSEAEFEKWLFVRVASVLFADKGGELITLNRGNCKLSVEAQQDLVERMSRIWLYSYIVLFSNSLCVRVMVYDPVKIAEALAVVPEWVLNEMGYEKAVSPGAFLEEIARRWRRKNRIPHEIGLVLGYPLKDVLGFIGLVPLQCTDRCGWRVYGDPEPSLKKSKSYRRAREEARAYVGKKSVDMSVSHAIVI